LVSELTKKGGQRERRDRERVRDIILSEDIVRERERERERDNESV